MSPECQLRCHQSVSLERQSDGLGVPEFARRRQYRREFVSGISGVDCRESIGPYNGAVPAHSGGRPRGGAAGGSHP